MKELSRLQLLIGNENIEKLRTKTILIIGLGGVGSYATESLARSGIGKLILVDKDIIDITNLNRQLMTYHSNIGQNKVDVWEKRIKDINNDIKIKKIKQCILKENIELLFDEKIDFIIDACDTIETKFEIIKQCLQKQIPFISCMGTGKRMDPTQMEITELSKTSYDPLAKVLRKKVRDEKIKGKIPVICSKEQPQKIDSTIIASNSFVPATAGLFCTSYVINKIIKGEK